MPSKSISQQLLIRSKENISRIANEAASNAVTFNDLLEIISGPSDPVKWVAAWCLSDSAVISSHSFRGKEMHLMSLIETLTDSGTKRSILRIFQEIDIPEDLNFRLADACFRFLKDPAESIAIKAFSITVLERITRVVPELKDELFFELERLVPFSGPAVRSRAFKVLKKLSKTR